MPVHIIGTINLDDDEQVANTIRRAAEGNEAAAWFLVHQIETALTERRVSAPLFDYAAVFFGSLLDLHEQERDDPKSLLQAFRKLHLVRPRGQPKQDDMERHALIARVLLLTGAGFPADVALNALDGYEGTNKGSYQSAYYSEPGEPGGSLKRFAINAELEALAGISQAELVDELTKTGALPPRVRR